MSSSIFNNWLDELGAKTPTPGGGAVAALSAAISAAQLEMVANYTTGPKWQVVEPRMLEIAKTLQKLRSDAIKLIDADAKAFTAVGSAYQLPKNTDDEKVTRKTAIQKALVEATKPPIDTSILAIELVEIAVEIAKTGNPNVISDVAVGATIARSALESAVVNIEINQHSIDDGIVVKELKIAIETATDSIQDADAVVESVRDAMSSS